MSQKFSDKVRAYVKTIPAGEVRTYAQVAQACGSPRAARAVGSIMRKNFDSEIPCHRVIRSDGEVGNYNRGGPQAKKKLLRAEGVSI